MRIYASISMARMTSVISFILLYSLHFERKGNNYFVIANISVFFFNEFNSFFIQMKISSVFFFRHYFSSLFIFIIELDENTDNREEHHRKKYRGGSYQNIERLSSYI